MAITRNFQAADTCLLGYFNKKAASRQYFPAAGEQVVMRQTLA